MVLHPPALKMGREMKCILCEMVCHSKQEMDEHMRSMLHHRELENLKGRDCGHKCKVCQVTVVSLTDYASHISSPMHKQNVEAAEHKSTGLNEEYFDQQLVELIEKRKETIRREEEAAAAKRDKEEAERRKQQEFAQRLQEAKDRFRLDCSRFPQPRNFRGSNWHGPWNGNGLSGGRAGEGAADSRSWHQSRQGKSATWHAQEPPNFRSWQSRELAGGSLHCQESWGNNQWNRPGFYGNQRGRLPWLSNRGSSNGIYGRNNIPQFPNRQPNHMGPPPGHPPPPMFFSRPLGQMPNRGIGQKDRMGDEHLNGDGPKAECDGNSNMNPKTFGSNPKLDKACRWAPYPSTKLLDTSPQRQAQSGPSEKHPKVPTAQKQKMAPDTSVSKKQKNKPVGSSADSLDRLKKTNNTNMKNTDGRSSGSSRGSAQRDGHICSLPGPSKQRAESPSEHRDGKLSHMYNGKTQIAKGSSQGHEQSKSTSKVSGPSMKVFPVEPLQSRQEQLLSERLNKAKDTALDKRRSVDNLSDNRVETVLHIVEEQQRECPESQIGANKENACEQDSAKAPVPDLIRPSPCEEDQMELVLATSDSQFLQSTQINTCTAESLQSIVSSRADEDEMLEEGAVSEATQAEDAGHCSESDFARCSDSQTVSGSAATGLSKLGLPPVLKRDLTKHISSKSKAGSHEPNLNIARRVRNLSESRKGESDKDSGLKPTVRQLISSSGSRRNVNWEQVYQEVRKKQEQGKGMPRFGIEMVSYDHEEHSQEEEDIPLLEGFQWETLMDSMIPTSTRKRSLSESSVAPDRAAALFPSHMSEEMAQRDAGGRPAVSRTEQHGYAPSPSNPVPGDGDHRRQQELKRILQQCQARAQKAPEGVWTGKALQRSDSALGDSSSGTELYDVHGTGKKRRAAGEVPSQDIPSLERKNKRRKVKPKKERLQVDQLLAVSLREEELSHSLQTLDNSLIQARAALEAAYLEVQRLLVVKQQVTTEMSTLRNKRIELLKGIQGGFEESAQPKVKEENMDSVPYEPHVAPSPAHTAVPSSGHTAQFPQCTSIPPPSLPFTPVTIKQEPLSPGGVSPDPEPMEKSMPCPHSTTPDLPNPPVSALPPDTGYNCQSSPQKFPELWQTEEEPTETTFEAECGPLGVVQVMERAVQATRESLTPSPDSKLHLTSFLNSRRTSETGSIADSKASQSCEPSSATGTLTLPSPAELKHSKRVRRLKKRKVLKKAQGAEQPESSDTEVDLEVLRPRRVRMRHRPSGGSQVGTSSPPGALEDREGVDEERDLNSTLKMVESEPEERMEVTAACEQSHGQNPVQATSHLPPPNVSQALPDPSRRESCNLVYNEVTSTSEIDMSCVAMLRKSGIRIPLEVPTMSKMSDVSSDVGEGDTPTEGAFDGHQEAVNGMQIHKGLLYTCSGDRTVRAFDLATHGCVAVFEGHSSKVNCLLVSATVGLQHRLYTGSSDQTIRCYSLKTGECEQQFSLPDRVLCLHNRWKVLYAGMGNGTVVTFNLKTNKQLDVFECHGPRGVSCLASGQEGARKILLVGSYDSTISVRDAKNGLLLRTLEGHTKTVLCMKVVNDLVFSGSSDQSVHAYNIYTGELVRVYKGHCHAVTVVTVLGKLMVTACLDKLIRIYDLQSQEQLQVYGGHKDMVMCMNVHKNMIYTGCYDGSVEAVKLNLMQNYPCLWHGCSMVFGVTNHLQQHLFDSHTGVSKCRWKNCEELFCSRNSSKQAVLMHMQKHAEESVNKEP